MVVEPTPITPDDGLNQARLLADVASIVHGPVPLADKLAWVTEAVCELAGATVGAYVSTVEGQVRLEAITGDTESGDIDDLAVVTVDAMLRADPRLEAPLRVADLARNPRWSRRGREERSRVSAWMAVPVIAADEAPCGVVLVGHPAPGHFGEREERAVAALGVAPRRRPRQPRGGHQAGRARGDPARGRAPAPGGGPSPDARYRGVRAGCALPLRPTPRRPPAATSTTGWCCPTATSISRSST